MASKLADHKLYTQAILPNPRRLHLFLAEKNIEIPEETVDVLKGEQKSDEHRARNMDARVPVLELKDGSHLSETVAIAQYIEDVLPLAGPRLFGDDVTEKAKVAMWNRRIEIEFISFCINATRYGPFHEALGWPEKKDIVAEMLRVANGYLDRLDKELGDKPYIALGDRVSMADISLFCTLDFCRKNCKFDLGNDGHNKNIERWYKNMLEREAVKRTPGIPEQ